MLGLRWPTSPSSWRKAITRSHSNNNSRNYGNSDKDDDVQARRLLVSRPAVEQVRYVGFGIGGAGNIRR